MRVGYKLKCLIRSNHIFSSSFHSLKKQGILVNILKLLTINYKGPLLVEHISYAARFTHVTASLVKDRADICCCPVTVVRQAFHHDGNTTWTITFIIDFFVIHIIRVT
ncbi:hypothetical protein D3C81_1830360 [compost metagenome]